MFLPLLLLAFAAFFGGCVGSFLNVVVYRLPRGLNLAYPGSACPRCRHPIRPQHNLPVLGWLLLRGKCYDCGAPIAARYPIVEAIFAAIAAGLAWIGPLADDALFYSPDPGEWNMPPGWAWARAGYWLWLLAAWFALAQIESDSVSSPDVRFSARLVAVSLLVAWLAPAIWPQLSIGRFELLEPRVGAIVRDTLAPDARWAAALAALVGSGTGALLAILAWPATGLGPAGKVGFWYSLGALALCGGFLGAPAVFVVAIGASALETAEIALARASPHKQRLSFTALAWGAAVAWIFLRHALAEPGRQVSWSAPMALAGAVAVAALSWAGIALRPRSAALPK